MKFFLCFYFTLISTYVLADNIVHETEWVSSKEASKILKTMDGNRLFPCKIQGQVEGIEIIYKGSYCPFLPDMERFYSRWGLSDKGYEKYSKKYENYGYREYSHTAFLDLSGNAVHQVTWVIAPE